MTRIRAGIFLVGLVLITAVLGLAGLPVLLAPRRLAARFGRFWAACILAWLRLSAGIGYEVRGREFLPDEPSILAFKHQSALEALALHQIFRDPAIICKRELLKIPVFGWYLKKSGVIAIDRAGGASVLRRMAADSRRVLAEGRSIVIFPEGTRGPVGGKLPYQPGVGALYTQLAVPLVPVALNTGLFWPHGLLEKRSGRAIIEILAPIPSGLDRRAVMGLLETRIEQAAARLLKESSYYHSVDKSVDETVDL